jgi:RNA polymerase sigma-70 factor (ECF subfamily)
VSEQRRQEVRELLETTAPDLLAYFERRVADHEDAADLLNETMLQAWRRKADLPTEYEQGRMWLFITARNVLSNHHRSRRRRTALLARIREQLAFHQVEIDDSQSHTVRHAVLRLPETQRELVILIHWDGFNISESAQILGVNASTARSRYAAARRSLHDSLLGIGDTNSTLVRPDSI